MSWIELKDAERFLRYTTEHGDARFLADRETEGSFFVDCAAGPSSLVPDVQEYHMGCIDDYVIGMKEFWRDAGFAEPDLLVRIVAAAALRNLYLYQAEMYGGRHIAPSRVRLAEIAKMEQEQDDGDAPPIPRQAQQEREAPRPEVNPILYEF